MPHVKVKAAGRPKKKKERKGSKRLGNYRTKYSKDDFKKAMQAAEDDRMSLREIAEEYGVPKSTLIDRWCDGTSPHDLSPYVCSGTICLQNFVSLNCMFGTC